MKSSPNLSVAKNESVEMAAKIIYEASKPHSRLLKAMSITESPFLLVY